jgi:hypothetical protein
VLAAAASASRALRTGALVEQAIEPGWQRKHKLIKAVVKWATVAPTGRGADRIGIEYVTWRA